MREWTSAARDEFDRYCASVHDRLAAEGADPAEVFEDLEGHVDREAEAAGLRTLTRDDVRRILERVGPVGDRASAASDPPPPPPPVPAERAEGRPWFQWAGGVVLPVATIATEALTGWCASVFFDPLPSFAHLLLACSVPAANAWLLRELARPVPAHPGRMAAASGAAVGIALLFTIPFLLLLPLALVALIYFGLGLLPLTPPLALLASIRIARRVRRETRAGDARPRTLAYGFAAAIAAFLLADLPKTVTNLGLQMAASADAGKSTRGVALLRALGSESLLLRACYDRAGVPMDLVSFVLQAVAPRAVDPTQARTVFYRVTGGAFNTVPPPRVSGIRGGDPTAFWDFDQAGPAVGAPLKGLSLASSRLDGSVDADAALAYVEWTLEFENDGARPAEARAHVALPPGGVVSRVTLWIDGEEREAAFGGRGQVRQAYERVVQARRDPILVTTSGPDLVLVQCFPVIPGALMKARLGITAPLLVEEASQATLVLPRVLDRNFAVRHETTHAVWIETKGRFAAAPAPYTLEPLAGGGEALRAAVSEAALAGEARTITLVRDPSQVEAWAPPEGGAPAVRQTLVRRDPESVRRLVVVLDASRGAREAGPALAAVLKRAPPSLEVAVVVAADTPTLLAKPQVGGEAASRAVADVVFVGGNDNVPAVVQAWDLAAESGAGIVVWVHGPQPVRLGGAAALAPRWERRPGGPRLVSFPIEEGPNEVLAELGDTPPISRWARRGALATNLAQALDYAAGAAPRLEAVRETGVKPPDLAAFPTSSHIRRLWAADSVRAALAAGDAASRKAAVEVAVKNRLVTPVSGAVVLETQAQYANAGLQPPGAETIPTIPEPETWLLIVVVGSTLGLAFWRRLRECLA
ncbi:MAG TPA: VIT domain-containing protein [Vicinamibacteria bacterium]|nr:VIT domain-containing protein [Vicinamibacteria bacterium]